MINTINLYITDIVFKFLPETRCYKIKRMLLRWSGVRVGSNVRIASSATITMNGSLNIENNVWIGHKVLIAGGNAEITIEENVDIAPCVTLVAGTHEKFTIEGRAAGRGYCLPIVIGKGSWIGANATILGGVTLGKCTLVAAGAMVTKNFPGNNIIAGVPARVIKIN